MKIAMYDLEGHLLDTFEVKSIVELGKIVKIPPISLLNALDGSINYTNGRQFRRIYQYIKHRIGDVSILSRNHLKPVHKYYNGLYICSYPSVEDAATSNDLRKDSVWRCCNGKYKTSGGFEWEYAKNKTENK